MITVDEKQNYLAVKTLSALPRGVTLKHHGHFYCLNRFYSYATKNNLEKFYKVSKSQDYCCVEMPNEDNKILKYNHRVKPMNIPFVVLTATVYLKK